MEDKETELLTLLQEVDRLRSKVSENGIES